MISLQQSHIDFKGAAEYGLEKEIWGITVIKMHNIKESENGLQTAESKKYCSKWLHFSVLEEKVQTEKT